MTIKVLTGLYSAGHKLDPKFAGLYLTSTAQVDGFGVIASAVASLTNKA